MAANQTASSTAHRTTGRVSALRSAAFVGFVLTFVLVIWTGYLVHLNADTVVAASPGWWLGGVTVVVYSAVGLVIVRSPAGNVVGPLMIAFGLGTAIQGWGAEYAVRSWLSGPLPLSSPIAHLEALLEVFPLAMIGLICLVFPSGRLPSRLWRVAASALVFGVTIISAASLFSAPTSERLPDGEILASALMGGPDLSSPVFGFLFFLFWIPMLLGVTRMIIRFFRSRGVERLQMKWLTFVLICGFALIAAAEAMPSSAAQHVRTAGSLVLFVGAPVAVGIAILRFHLYDVDRIISRTVGYALVVGLLGAVYAALAVWLPSRLAGESALFVAGATLAVAALFNSVRLRVLRWVDRRFYRSRFDAQRVAEDFSGRLRDYADVVGLTSDWTTVVTSTMRPALIGVWVKGQ